MYQKLETDQTESLLNKQSRTGKQQKLFGLRILFLVASLTLGILIYSRTLSTEENSISYQDEERVGMDTHADFGEASLLNGLHKTVLSENNHEDDHMGFRMTAQYIPGEMPVGAKKYDVTDAEAKKLQPEDEILKTGFEAEVSGLRWGNPSCPAIEDKNKNVNQCGFVYDQVLIRVKVHERIIAELSGEQNCELEWRTTAVGLHPKPVLTAEVPPNFRTNAVALKMVGIEDEKRKVGARCAIFSFMLFWNVVAEAKLQNDDDKSLGSIIQKWGNHEKIQLWCGGPLELRWMESGSEGCQDFRDLTFQPVKINGKKFPITLGWQTNFGVPIYWYDPKIEAPGSTMKRAQSRFVMLDHSEEGKVDKEAIANAVEDPLERSIVALLREFFLISKNKAFIEELNPMIRGTTRKNRFHFLPKCHFEATGQTMVNALRKYKELFQQDFNLKWEKWLPGKVFQLANVKGTKPLDNGSGKGYYRVVIEKRIPDPLHDLDGLLTNMPVMVDVCTNCQAEGTLIHKGQQKMRVKPAAEYITDITTIFNNILDAQYNNIYIPYITDVCGKLEDKKFESCPDLTWEECKYDLSQKFTATSMGTFECVAPTAESSDEDTRKDEH